MKPFPSLRIFVALVLSSLCAHAADQTIADLAIIDLHNRTADEVLPVLRPLVGSDVALSGVDYKLLVRGSPSEVAHIREILTALDRAPRQLIISVRYGENPQNNTSELGATGEASNQRTQIEVHGGIHMSTASDNSISSIRVLEGNGAHIATGKSMPVINVVMIPRTNDQRVVAGVSTDYRELTSGFDVVPRVNGERVILNISIQQHATDSDIGGATVQRTTTTVAGRLGEWIELTGVAASASEQSASVNSGSTQRLATQSDRQTVAVKVEQVE